MDNTDSQGCHHSACSDLLHTHHLCAMKNLIQLTFHVQSLPQIYMQFTVYFV